MKSILTNNGLNLPLTYSEDEFFEAGKFLARIEHGTQWAIGDWFNAIKWGDKEAACNKAGLNYTNAKWCGYISATFELLARANNLTHRHHAYLAIKKLTDEQRIYLLKSASEHQWKTPRLKDEINKVLGIEKKTEIKGFDNKVEAVLSQLPKSVSNKVRRAISNVFGELKHNFQDQVEKEVKSRLKDDRVRILQLRDEAQTERDAAVRIRANIDAHMSEKEFKAIRSCLHPDRECSADQKAKAFSLFNSLKDTINDKATSWE